jgi:DUF971 family protein
VVVEEASQAPIRILAATYCEIGLWHWTYLRYLQWGRQKQLFWMLEAGLNHRVGG